jgi:hypothetical protein
VIQVLALEVDLRAADVLREAARVIDRARAADVVLELVGELGLELGIGAEARVRRSELVERRAQRLGDEHSAVRAEMPRGVGRRVVLPISWHSHLHVARSG